MSNKKGTNVFRTVWLALVLTLLVEAFNRACPADAFFKKSA